MSLQEHATREDLEAIADCIRELRLLARIGNADPEATGGMADKEVMNMLKRLGFDSVVEAYNQVARY